MSPSTALEALKALLPAQFEQVIFHFAEDQRASIPRATQADAAIALVRIAEQRSEGLAALACVIERVSAPSARSESPRVLDAPPRVDPPRVDPPHVAKVCAVVRDALTRQGRVRDLFTRLGLGESPEAIAEEIVRRRQAVEVLAAIEAVLRALATDVDAVAEDRQAIETIFQSGVRYAVDWVEAVHRAREELARPRTGRRNTIELPVWKAPIAELVLAGVDDRAPAFELTGDTPLVAFTHVEEAAMLRAPIMIEQRRFEAIMVKHLAEGVFKSNRDLVHARRDPGSAAALAEMEGVLRKLGYPRFGEPPRPYYVTFGGEDGDLWQVVCEAPSAATALPSLRLVRLGGAVNPDESEMVETLKNIQRLLQGGPRS